MSQVSCRFQIRFMSDLARGTLYVLCRCLGLYGHCLLVAGQNLHVRPIERSLTRYRCIHVTHCSSPFFDRHVCNCTIALPRHAAQGGIRVPVCVCNYGQLFPLPPLDGRTLISVARSAPPRSHLGLRRVAICLYLLLLYLSPPLISRFGLAFCRNVISPTVRNERRQSAWRRARIRASHHHPSSSLD